jgi:hypothetical protein
MSELRALITRALLDSGVYIDDARFDRVRLEAAGAAGQHLRPALQRVCGHEPAAVAASVGLSAGAIARMFGHGWQQAAGFAALAGVRAHRVADVACLGALLSLGIVLFDHLIDTFPERRAVLADRLIPELLTAEPSGATAAPSGDLGVDSLAAVAVEVMSGARRLGGRPDDVEHFHQVIAAMYRGELASLQGRRAGEPPSATVWEALNAKSALPATAVATLAKLANAAASNPIRAVVDRAAALVGEAFWIVDDLADVPADWEAGGWSRPVWLLLDRLGETPANGADAVRLLLQTGIAAAEAKRLAQVLAELAALPGSSQRMLLRPVQAAVRSWVEEIPPEP